MSLFPLKSTHAPVENYYAALAQFHQDSHDTEGNTRSAFADVLKKCASPYDWHLIEEYQFKGTAKQPLRADGALIDPLALVHGPWEAKDTADDLQKEIKSKVAHGYPLTNILISVAHPRRPLPGHNRIALDCDLTKPENLIEIPHPAAHRRLHGPQRRRNPPAGVRQIPLRLRRPHPRPLHRRTDDRCCYLLS